MGYWLAVVSLWVILACSPSSTAAGPTPRPGADNSSVTSPTKGETTNPAVPMAMDATLSALTKISAASLLGKVDPSAAPQPLILADQHFYQDPGGLDQAFLTIIVKNPNQDWGFSSVPFTVAIYDKVGNSLIQPINEDLGPLFPGQTAAFRNPYHLSEKSEVGKIDVQLGKPTANQPGKQNLPLSVDRVKLVEHSDYRAVTGIIKNSLKDDIHLINAEALAYDANGKLISAGGGIPIDFIPGNGQIAVEVRLETSEKPARLDLMPRLVGYSQIEPLSDEVKDIHITGIGVRLGPANTADYTAIFENRSQKQLYSGLEYRFAVYAEDGSVIAAQGSTANILFPNDRLAVLGTMQLPGDARVARADVQFNYPETAAQEQSDNKALKLTANPLTASPDATISADTENEYYNNIVGTISNSLDQDIKGATVIVVAYDDQGKIISSTRQYIDISAKGSAELKASMDKTPTKPVRVVLFPSWDGE